MDRTTKMGIEHTSESLYQLAYDLILGIPISDDLPYEFLEEAQRIVNALSCQGCGD